MRTYSELRSLGSFLERYHYLRLRGQVGHPTFGSERYLNQAFYTSKEWRDVRRFVIARDNGLDLGVTGHEVYQKVIIHHMNPITPKEIVHSVDSILDPEFLITTSHDTHNAIHYGDESLLRRPLVERHRGDTKLW